MSVGLKTTQSVPGAQRLPYGENGFAAPSHQSKRSRGAAQPQATSRSATSATVVPFRRNATTVQPLPNLQRIPDWLQSLTKFQKLSAIAAFSLTATVLAVYGQTVYSQQLWNQEYQKLGTLQRHERQLTTANEGLKHQLALQAERPGTNLVLPSPANTIFMQPAPPRAVPKSTAASPPVQPLPPDQLIGY